MSKINCPECGSKDMKKSLKEIVCKGCGFIVEDDFVIGCN